MFVCMYVCMFTCVSGCHCTSRRREHMVGANMILAEYHQIQTAIMHIFAICYLRVF